MININIQPNSFYFSLLINTDCGLSTYLKSWIGTWIKTTCHKGPTDSIQAWLPGQLMTDADTSESIRVPSFTLLPDLFNLAKPRNLVTSRFTTHIVKNSIMGNVYTRFSWYGFHKSMSRKPLPAASVITSINIKPHLPDCHCPRVIRSIRPVISKLKHLCRHGICNLQKTNLKISVSDYQGKNSRSPYHNKFEHVH